MNYLDTASVDDGILESGEGSFDVEGDGIAYLRGNRDLGGGGTMDCLQ